MPVACTHGAFQIGGMVHNHQPRRVERKTQITSPFGLDGAIEIVGGKDTQIIEIALSVFNGWNNRADLINHLAAIDGRIGKNDQLIIYDAAGVAMEAFQSCTFEGFERDGNRAILSRFANPTWGWQCRGVLVFRRLKFN